MALDYGYIHIERGTGNAIQLAVKIWNIFIHYKPITEELPDGDYFHTDLGTVARFITCKDIYFKTKIDAELFLDRMDVLNPSRMTLEIQTNSGSLPGSLLNFLSGINSMEVICTDIAPLTKVAYGDGTVYKVGMCKFKTVSKLV